MSRYADVLVRTDDAVLRASDIAQVIARSWRRSELCGVSPTRRLEELEEHDVDRESALARAADPVLSSMMEDLAGAGVAVILADRDGVVLDVRPPSLRGAVADLAFNRIGRRCTEEEVGTNSIGTVLELSRPMRIYGDEHYLHSLREFDCLGAPIINPGTGRIEGALSLCAARASLQQALTPFLSQSVRAIREQLLSGTDHAHLELLRTFRVASRRTKSVALLGTDLILTTPTAAAMLEPLDHVQLRELGTGVGPDGVILEEAELASGKHVQLVLHPCGARDDSVLVEIREQRSLERAPIPRGPNARMSTAQAVTQLLNRARTHRDRLLISGEGGTGRTSAVRELSCDERMIVLDCADSTDGPSWEQRLRAAVDEATTVPADGEPALFVLESIEQLAPEYALRVLNVVNGSDAWMVMTAPPIETLGGEHAGLVACCSAHVHLPPVRARAAELPILVEDITRAYCKLVGRSAPRWTSEAIAALVVQQWPGNLHELRAVVERAVRETPGGRVGLEALPERVGSVPKRALSPLQQSERQVIGATLLACKGNKVQTANQLGISRTTLYKRMRGLDLS